MTTLTEKCLNNHSVVYRNKKYPLGIERRSIELIEGGVLEDEILIKVHSVGLNPVDKLVRKLAYPILNLFRTEFGLGFDYSGTVVSIGSKAAEKYSITLGDKVCGQISTKSTFGTATEYLRLRDGGDWGIIKKPLLLNMTEAGSFGLVYSTAVGMINEVDLPDGATVFINGGATSVGRYLISLLSLELKVKRIVTTCSGRSKQGVLDLGATDVIDYTATDNLIDAILGYGKSDVLFDCSGGAAVAANASRIVKSLDNYITIAPGAKEVVLTELMSRTGLSYFKLYLISGKFHLVEAGAGYDKATDLFDSGKIKPFIHSVHQWQDFQKAFETLLRGKPNGKVVIQVDASANL